MTDKEMQEIATKQNLLLTERRNFLANAIKKQESLERASNKWRFSHHELIAIQQNPRGFTKKQLAAWNGIKEKDVDEIKLIEIKELPEASE